MTEQERQEIKARLIELGFWGADEAGDQEDAQEARSVTGENTTVVKS